MLRKLVSQCATLLAIACLFINDGVLAQNNTNGYTVYSSFVFARTGERTPQLTYSAIQGTSMKLTAYGANQMHNLGSFFRNRYIGNSSAAPHMILGLNSDLIDDLQITVMSPDADFTTKSALAFMQAFYPPYNLANSMSNQYDPTSIMVNNTYINFPMNGYQIPMIQTYDSYSPGSVWINGGANCLNSDISRAMYYNTSSYLQRYQESLPLYKVIAPLFAGTPYDPSGWSYGLGWGIYELLDYLNRHNTTVNHAFSNDGAYPGMLPMFARYANAKLWAMYGNQSVTGSYPRDKILTIAGQALASIILEQLDSNINNLGIFNKFNIAVGDFYPMISLMSLLGLGDFVSSFQSLPPYGSALVFEVFSYSSKAPNIPDPNDLYVRFLFRNASDVNSPDPNAATPEIQAYPMFGRGPSGTDMSWKDFHSQMSQIAMGTLAEWCTLCQATSLFCLPFLEDGSTSSSRKKHMTPAIGGVIGAFVTLTIASLLCAAAIFLGGLRFHRNRSRNSPLGGFKGSAKLASDADLSLPNNAVAPAGVVVGSKGHERVGSWELKNGEEKEPETGVAGHQRFASLGSTVVGRPSYEADPNDISEELHSTPTRPRESF